MLTGQTLGRRIRGTWQLTDPEGNLIAKKKQVLARIPYLTDRGTFVYRGSPYVLTNQQRLRSGIFTRQRESGEIESHLNFLPGEGVSHRYFLDPEKGVFYAQVQQAKIPLLPLLRNLGATDQQLRKAWGDEILNTNRSQNNAELVRESSGRSIPV